MLVTWLAVKQRFSQILICRALSWCTILEHTCASFPVVSAVFRCKLHFCIVLIVPHLVIVQVYVLLNSFNVNNCWEGCVCTSTSASFRNYRLLIEPQSSIYGEISYVKSKYYTCPQFLCYNVLTYFYYYCRGNSREHGWLVSKCNSWVHVDSTCQILSSVFQISLVL